MPVLPPVAGVGADEVCPAVLPLLVPAEAALPPTPLVPVPLVPLVAPVPPALSGT